MADHLCSRSILFYVAFLATISGFLGNAQAEQLGDRTDVLEIQKAVPEPAPKFELEMPETAVATVGAPDSVAFLSRDNDELLTPMSKLDWDEPLVVAAAARRRAAQATPRRFELTTSTSTVIRASSEQSLSSAPMPALSAVPRVSMEDIGKDDEQESATMLSVNPEPSGKTLLGALLISLVVIGGFTHVFRPRNETVKPIQFH